MYCENYEDYKFIIMWIQLEYFYNLGSGLKLDHTGVSISKKEQAHGYKP